MLGPARRAGRCRRCSAGRTGARTPGSPSSSRARRRGAPQDRALPFAALRREQAALGARPSPRGRRRGEGGRRSRLGTAGELPRAPPDRGAHARRRSAVRRAHPAVESRRARLGPGAARAVRPAAGLPSRERADLPRLGHARRSRAAALPLVAVNGDQSAAVFAFGWPEPDSAYVNIGTSAFVQRALERASRPRAAPAHRHHPRRRPATPLGRSRATSTAPAPRSSGCARGWASPTRPPRCPAGSTEPGDPPLFLNGIAGLGGPFWQSRSSPRASSATASRARRRWRWWRASPSCCRRTSTRWRLRAAGARASA